VETRASSFTARWADGSGQLENIRKRVRRNRTKVERIEK
jgi:hypothetical protein